MYGTSISIIICFAAITAGFSKTEKSAYTALDVFYNQGFGYAELKLGGGPFSAIDIPKVPVAVTIFPGEIYQVPRSWAEKSFHKLIYFKEVDKGGHFAAWEVPELFAS